MPNGMQNAKLANIPSADIYQGWKLWIQSIYNNNKAKIKTMHEK